MRIRVCQFAMVPLWVLRHPEIRGNGPRIAAYVGLRVVAFEYPDREWRSERQIGDEVGDVVGSSGERARKHLSVFRRLGMIHTDNGELVIVDDPTTGSSAGSDMTQLGSYLTQSADHTSTSIEKKKTARVGSRVEVVDNDFESFWSLYPRKVAKPTAHKAWKSALTKVQHPTYVIDGLKPWVNYWTQRREPEFIPHPATWLNQERWNDTPPAILGQRKTAPGMNRVREIWAEEQAKKEQP